MDWRMHFLPHAEELEPGITYEVREEFKLEYNGNEDRHWESETATVPIGTIETPEPLFPATTRFVGSDGWQTGKQTLWDAEQEYGVWNQEHDQNIWDQRDMRNADSAYVDENTPDGQPETNVEAWEGLNAHATSDGEKFKGGFAGDCTEGAEWMFVDTENEWRCEGALDMDQAVILPESSGSTIGMAIMPFVASDEAPIEVDHVPDGWMDFQRAVIDDDDWGSGSDITGLSARCWPGEAHDMENKDKQLDDGNYIQGENVDVSSEEPFGISGSVSMSGFSEYSCEWGFQTSGDIPTTGCEGEGFLEDHLVACGTAWEIHDEPGEDWVDGFETEYGFDSGGSTSQLSDWDSVVSAH